MKVVKDFASFMKEQKQPLLEGFKDLNDDQLKTVKMRSERLSEQFLEEVTRLLNSGSVGKNKFDVYPLTAIFKVALENITDKNRVATDETKDYRNLKRF